MEHQVIVFKLSREEYAASITEVKEIVRYQKINRIPNTPVYVEGVINLRDKIFPVIDLKKRFNLGSSEIEDQTRIIIIELGNINVGLIVDSVEEVLRIGEENIDDVPKTLVSIDTKFISGIAKVGDRIITMLNLQEVFNAAEKTELEAV
ncbi:chemotaxis protein CheW [Bacillota bacterium LX-D]|nr:chemotaxis protein CheW [Bacillota bacterium LX-D]